MWQILPEKAFVCLIALTVNKRKRTQFLPVFLLPNYVTTGSFL